jgi:hypothetical protein
MRSHTTDLLNAASNPSDPTTLLDAFLLATVFSPAPPDPGVIVLDIDGMPTVPVFTTEQGLADFAGDCDWFSTTGLDLLGLLPIGVPIALDPNGRHPLLIDPAATKLEYTVVTAGDSQ